MITAAEDPAKRNASTKGARAPALPCGYSEMPGGDVCITSDGATTCIGMSDFGLMAVSHSRDGEGDDGVGIAIHPDALLYFLDRQGLVDRYLQARPVGGGY